MTTVLVNTVVLRGSKSDPNGEWLSYAAAVKAPFRVLVNGPARSDCLSRLAADLINSAAPPLLCSTCCRNDIRLECLNLVRMTEERVFSAVAMACVGTQRPACSKAAVARLQTRWKEEEQRFNAAVPEAPLRYLVRVCDGCKELEKPDPGSNWTKPINPFTPCLECGVVFYCSDACREAKRTVHKPYCVRPKDSGGDS